VSSELHARGAVRAPLDEALASEIRALDLRVARTWQVLTFIGIVGGFLVDWALGFAEGTAVASLSVVGFVWFTVEREWLTRPSANVAVQIGTLVEGVTPIAFLVAIAKMQSPVEALGNYVPPLLFAAIMIAAIARLRPEATLFFGAFNGVMFLVVYFVGLEGTLSEAERARPMLSPPMQVVRATAFVAGGALAYSIGRALRRAIGRAERSVRKADLFGKYRLGEKLGAGGMGTVHRAIYCPEGGFERTVAVKLLHGHLADKPEFIRAFREEAELSARLVHPNIVQVLDFGRWGDSYFLAMEHVDGVTLSTVMRLLGSERRAMDPEDVAWLGVNLLAGLEFSHDGARDAHGKRLRVIHRDLCPANVLISSNGDVRISDFGIAKALGDATFSETKTIAGHAGYMAPEQVRAEPLDERCDLFAVGVVLWELCAGRSLFRRGSEGMSALAVLNHEVPPLLGLPDERREGWEAFFRRALAPDKGARFQGAAEMSSALAALRTTTQPRHEAFAALVMEARAERAPSPHEPTTEATKVDG
jgi:hypothetical protein